MKVILSRLILIGLVAAVVAVNATAQQSAPTLVSPASGQVMDNGCVDRSDSMDWDFEWTAVPGAKKYHLFVKTSRAPIAAIDNQSIKTTRHEVRKRGAYTGPAGYTGWTWKVRALVGNEWTEWSEERSFTLEPVNTDCK